MSAFMTWLRSDPTGFWFEALWWKVGWALVVAATIGRYAGPNKEADRLLAKGWRLLYALPPELLIEDLARCAPIMVAVWFTRNDAFIVAAAVLSAVGFGLWHTANGMRWWFVLIMQGVGGWILNLVFLRYGGLRFEWGRAFLASYLMHLVYDALLFGVALLATKGLKAFERVR